MWNLNKAWKHYLLSIVIGSVVVVYISRQGSYVSSDDKLSFEQQMTIARLAAGAPRVRTPLRSIATVDTGQNNANKIAALTQRSLNPQALVIEQRLEHAKNVCAKYLRKNSMKNIQLTATIWVYEPVQMYYCISPKVGCTYWKQVMRFLGGDYNHDLKIETPDDIDRNYVHYAGISGIQSMPMNNPIARNILSTGHSFMFSRDPYSRLWSGYIDKIFLPDFWGTDAKAIVNKRTNATEFEKRCSKDVTFKEFLQHIARIYPGNQNEHWQPIVKQCSPCHSNFEFIGKQETFTADANYILEQLGLQNLKSNVSRLVHVFDEMAMITDYNFKVKRNLGDDCFVLEDIATRLWKTFQYNGYVHRDFDIPLSDMRADNFKDNPAVVFLKYVEQTVQYQYDQHISLSKQKREMMIQAYRDIPKQLLEQIQKVYELDFELFSYDRDLAV